MDTRNPTHIVLNVHSSTDYNSEIPHFETGGARWFSTKDGKERVGDRFGFVHFQKKVVEVFNIDEIKTGIDVKEFTRPEWTFEDPERNILILSKKLGEISYNFLCENTKTQNNTGHEYNPNHPLRGITRRSWSLIAEKAINPYTKIKYIELEETESNEEGYLYFIREELSYSEDIHYVKVGFSNNPQRRLKTHQCGNPRKLIIHNTIKCKDYKNAEKYMHRYFSDRKSELGGGTEWFFLSLEEIDQICSAAIEKK